MVVVPPRHGRPGGASVKVTCPLPWLQAVFEDAQTSSSTLTSVMLSISVVSSWVGLCAPVAGKPRFPLGRQVHVLERGPAAGGLVGDRRCRHICLVRNVFHGFPIKNKVLRARQGHIFCCSSKTPSLGVFSLVFNCVIELSVHWYSFVPPCTRKYSFPLIVPRTGRLPALRIPAACASPCAFLGSRRCRRSGLPCGCAALVVDLRRVGGESTPLKREYWSCISSGTGHGIRRHLHSPQKPT